MVIGVCSGGSPFHLAQSDGAGNPALTNRDVRCAPTEFVADPFMIPVRGVWRMFIEAMNQQTKKGEIRLAEVYCLR